MIHDIVKERILLNVSVVFVLVSGNTISQIEYGQIDII